MRQRPSSSSAAQRGSAGSTGRRASAPRMARSAAGIAATASVTAAASMPVMVSRAWQQSLQPTAQARSAPWRASTRAKKASTLPVSSRYRSSMERGMVAHGRYRYRLWRCWLPGAATAVWVMLNPSTADDVRDDATIRRCLALTRAWGFGALEVVNLYGLRATDPAALRVARDPVGPDNDEAVAGAARRGDAVFAAWGAHGAPRAAVGRQLLRGCAVWCLGVTL